MKDLDVLNQLLTSTNITNLIADRIWADWLPEQTTFPAITCTYTNDTPINTLTGDTLQGREIITINIWANDKPTANTLLSEVKIIMNGFGVRGNTLDLSDAERKEWRYSVDYSIFNA